MFRGCSRAVEPNGDAPSSWKEPEVSRRTEGGHLLAPGKHLVPASTPLNKAEPYGEFRNFPASYITFWERLQRDGIVRREMEYEEPPRGRVTYSTRTGQFEVLADRCIASDKPCTAIVIERLGLPRDTKVVTHSAYTCAKCLATETTQQQEQEEREL